MAGVAGLIDGHTVHFQILCVCVKNVEFWNWHTCAIFRTETGRLVVLRMAVPPASEREVSSSVNEPHDVGFPACHTGQEKFNWGSELSVPQDNLSSTAISALVPCIFACRIRFKRRPVPGGLKKEHSGKSLPSFDLPWFKRAVADAIRSAV